VNIIKQLKDLAFEKQLKSELAKNHREHRLFNAQEVASVGILYHFTDDETDRVMNDFVGELRGNKRKVMVLGYTKDKVLPSYFSPKLNWDILIPKNINWFNKPTDPFVKSFCKEEFDLLIDLTMDDFEPIIYAGALSRAHFKTGSYTIQHAKYYDLMIHTEHVQSLPEFIKHVKHYISKVNL